MFKNAIIKTINLAMVFGTPPMTACVIFASYEMLVSRLSATLAFTTLSLFNILRFPLVVLPKAMRALSECLASLTRVESFLLKEVPTDADGNTKSSSAGVRIVSSVCVWGGGRYALTSTQSTVCTHRNYTDLMHLSTGQQQSRVRSAL
jgi:hypothetical protein